ncbi:hypothetical protein MATL_G00160790 [Megalops atlanticus]|uniref:Uncharacterized protein n=1 Tax=Megalops atlanticus TaxID=7932 RepID=A0A9D3PUU8_MEGAT|nr:hypothetical protein MATL_G00160790 [Megalops atlanticus]
MRAGGRLEEDGTGGDHGDHLPSEGALFPGRIPDTGASPQTQRQERQGGLAKLLLGIWALPACLRSYGTAHRLLSNSGERNSFTGGKEHHICEADQERGDGLESGPRGTARYIQD